MGRVIRVMIVDDHARVRRALRALMATAADIAVVGEAADGRAALELVRSLKPDVIIMDLVMPRLDGIEAIQHIMAEQPHTRILVLTNFSDGPRVLAALAAGARGYLLKDAAAGDVISAVHDIDGGKLALHPSLTHIVMKAMQEVRE